LTLIPQAAALAVADAIADTTGLQWRLKWPNDVMIQDKKVAGILCESAGGQPGSIVVVGIGINVNSRPEDFPTDIQTTVATLLTEGGSPVDRAALLSTLVNRLEEQLGLLSPETVSALVNTYRGRCATLGRFVRATLGDSEVVEGIAEAIGDDGSLLIRRQSTIPSACPGDLVEIRSADIVHLRGVTGDRHKFNGVD
jgi:BirA family biotin operon repressor/biotin-[acetyl-CoA-carboxylase] ligase